MYYLYILKSGIKAWHYIGITNDTEKRFKEHNAGKTRSTKAYRPFMVIYTESFSDKAMARKREIYLKKNYKIRQELLNKIDKDNYGAIV